MTKESYNGVYESKEPATVDNDKLLKGLRLSKKLDVVQVAGGAVAMAVGAVAAPVLIPIGAGYVAFNGVEYVATGKAIKWRENKLKEQAAKAAADAAAEAAKNNRSTHFQLLQAA